MAYARQRDANEMPRWVREIQLRADQRFGELSLQLEKAERARTDLHPTAGKQTKEHALAAAGVSTSTAHRCEELAGGRDERAQAAAREAAER